MTKAESTTPAIIIPEEHQSAPKEHWADKEIRKAADEIQRGNFVPEIAADDPEQFFNYGPTQALGLHPRVQEAMEKMKTEIRESKNPQEATEKRWALHEMNRQMVAKNKWQGQERWEGDETEEMRLGLILTPQQFYERLCRVTGPTRILLSRNAVKTHPSAKSARVGLYVTNREFKNRMGTIIRPGQPEEKDELLRVGTLQWPLGTEWMVMNFDQYGVPTTAKYLGWRTCLLTMIRCGAITEKEANKAFPVGTSPAAAWYKEQLFEMRSIAGTVQ